MLINFLKFFHVLFALSLLGSVIYCIALANSYQYKNINKFMLWISLFAVLTGTLLVYPKHFTFHTPWIEAAYILTFVFSLGVLLLTLLKRNFLFVYFLLGIILIFIIHDAVTKYVL